MFAYLVSKAVRSVWHIVEHTTNELLAWRFRTFGSEPEHVRCRMLRSHRNYAQERMHAQVHVDTCTHTHTQTNTRIEMFMT